MSIPRQSNIELMRIFAMFFIVMHHYVVNSGVTELFDYSNPSVNMIFLRLVGAWGKTAINAFVLITGYFMCESCLTPKRFCKIFFEWMFYAFVVYVVLLLVGYEQFSVRRIAELVFAPFRGVDKGFTMSFVWFYLGIPFYNVLLRALNRRQLLGMIGLLCGLFVLPTTFFRNGQVFHHVFWYMTIYFIGAFIRKYPSRWMSTNMVCFPLLLGAVGLTLITLYGRLICSALPMKVIANILNPSESCMLIPLVIGILVFLVFKNLKLRGGGAWINRLASTMFGVLCIHAASDAMRTALWGDLCKVTRAYSYPLWTLAGHMLVCVLGVMLVCSLVDILRQKFIEVPVFGLIFGKERTWL